MAMEGVLDSKPKEGEVAAAAYASRVYPVRCTRTLRWKTEYKRDAYASVRRAAWAEADILG
jgi:hypothetical protein